MAILREQGVNGHVEMAAAFHRAGFAAIDLHMSDILAGRLLLEDFKGVVACDGFSYSDVLGAGFLLAMSLGALLSVGVEILGFAPFRGASRLGPLIATLGLSFILFQGALVWRTYQGSWIPREHRSVPGLPEVPTDGIPSFLPEINLVKYFGLPMNVVIRFSDVFVIFSAVVLVALANWFIQKSRTGRAIRAVSQNPQAAQMLGVDIGGTIRKAFAFGGAFAGAAGFIFALYYSRPFGSHGAQSGLFAFMI